MRIFNLIKGRRSAGFFRIFLGMILSLILVMGGIVLDSRPAQANIIVSPDPTNAAWQECVPIVPITFTHGPSANPPGWLPEVFFFWPSGSLPAGITLDPNTGVLSGCPATGTAGTSGNFLIGCTALVPFPFSIDFSMPAATVNWTISNPPPCNMVITPVFYPVAWEGLPYAMALGVTGGVGPFSWSAVGLPAGISVTDATNGIISGTPAPGTCGLYTVTVTCTDTGTCCCPPVSRPLAFIVDCWSNYVFLIPAFSSCDFNVVIGPGLASGQTSVLINGSPSAVLAGGGSQTFTSLPCRGNVVMVDQTVPGADANTRFAVIGLNYKVVNGTDNYAYFDYARQVMIRTASNPEGIVQLPGTGFYTVGGTFNSSAPSPLEPGSQRGEKYLFKEWRLPSGGTNPNRDLVFTVDSTGTAVAVYNTYYLLNIVSDYPAVAESSWELKDSTASYSLALQDIPIPNFWGAIGGVMKPVNPSGTHVMTGPATVKIQWNYDYTVPIILIVVVVLLFFGLVGLAIFLVLRGKRSGTVVAAKPSAPVMPAAAEKQGVTETGSNAKPNFCPNCGAPVEKDAAFCKKCGVKQEKG
jgi:hypothetical protein